MIKPQDLNDITYSAIKGMISDKKNNQTFNGLIENLKESHSLPLAMALAVLNDNLAIVTNLIEKFGIDKFQEVPLSVSLIKEYIDKSVSKDIDSTETPILVLAAIGGSIEVFNYLFEKGADATKVGFALFSHKKKNAVITNIVGACAYYGNNSLLEVILRLLTQKYPSNNSILNYRATESRSKSKSNIFSKEFSGLTPAMLSLYGQKSKQISLEVFKLLTSKKIDLSLLDNEGNTYLHLACKVGNIQAVEFLVNELNFSHIATNGKNETPIILIKSLGLQSEEHKSVEAFLNSLDSGIDKGDINDIIDGMNIKKKNKTKKKGKKGENDDNFFLSNFEDRKIIIHEPKPAAIVKEEKQEDDEINFDKYSDIDEDKGEQSPENVKEQKNKSNYKKPIQQQTTDAYYEKGKNYAKGYNNEYYNKGGQFYDSAYRGKAYEYSKPSKKYYNNKQQPQEVKYVTKVVNLEDNIVPSYSSNANVKDDNAPSTNLQEANTVEQVMSEATIAINQVEIEELFMSDPPAEKRVDDEVPQNQDDNEDSSKNKEEALEIKLEPQSDIISGQPDVINLADTIHLKTIIVSN